MSTCDIDYNIYFDAEADADAVADAVADRTPIGSDLAELAAQGHNLHSLYSDPLLKDPENGDFSLRENSPAHDLGIVSVDVNDAGLLS
jgi:hypothetical protein